MFAHLRHHLRILVSGPQRSGTTIATEMIAADTGHQAMREEAFGVHDETRLRKVLRQRDIVVQCPTMMVHLPELADDDTLVVWMRRPVEEIVASQQRINWQGEHIERQCLGLPDDERPIAVVKNTWWAANRHRISHTLEVDYASLAQHPLWIEPAQRRGFHARQTARNA